ncbi:putative transcriptional regulator [Archaeoglobus fulgidus DSM 8774]|uniref:Putative transcriptional regulator n=3 Tax=Archaeoglobus TaxID=2233 RepID=A0A075WHF2_ARCFL|nr:transcriptional regulator [Archaeoglobus fulgidus]AIG97003.1 putative transcriptional regulator [Archaeoglobus fulgidus DSM 8774]
MKPHCVMMVKYVLPALRAKVALELIDRGYRVKDVADLLGLTQAAVSQYLKSKRGQRGLDIIKKSDGAKRIVRELVDDLVAGRITIEDEVDYLCRVCEILREEGLIEGEGYAV